MLATFMPCGAKLPVIALFAGAFFPDAAWVGPLMYNAWPIWECWMVFAAVCLISMGVMLGMVKWLERVTK